MERTVISQLQKHRRPWALAAGVLIVSLAAAPVHAAADPAPLRVGWIPAVGLACVASAVETARNHHLPIDFLSFRNSTEVLLALNTGQLDVGTLGYSVAATALQRVRVDGKFIAGATAGTTSVVVRAHSGIHQWADLKGRTVGAVRGSSEYTALQGAIAEAGYTLGKNINFVNFQTPTDVMIALRNGDIDAAASFEPAIAIAVAGGYAERAPAMSRTLFRSTYAISQGIMASNDALAHRRGDLVTLLRTYVSDCQRLKSDPNQAIRAYMKYQAGNRNLLIDSYTAIVNGIDWRMPMAQVRVVPRYLSGIKPAAVAPLTVRFGQIFDYGPISQATGQSPAALGDAR